MTDEKSPRPLEGLRALDFTQNLPGPYASFMLAAWGVEVIKVEPPRGDPGRFMEPFFSIVNRGKRSLVLDLRDPASAPILERLIARSDILLEGFRPGVMDRLGAGWERAASINPRLIYCSISAFGQEGPRRDEPGHDLNLQALTGICHLERDADGLGRGSMLPVADLSSSLIAVASISAAIAARERDGRGRYLDVAMADGALSFAHLWGDGVDLAANARDALGSSPAPGLTSIAARPLMAALDRLKLYAMPHYGVFRTLGGGQLALGIVDEGHFWKALTKELGLTRLGSLPLPARIALGPALRPVIAARLRMRSRAHWLSRFEAIGVPATAVLTPREARREPQFIARGSSDGADDVRSPLPGAKSTLSPAPGRGEHTEAILGELESDT